MKKLALAALVGTAVLVPVAPVHAVTPTIRDGIVYASGHTLYLAHPDGSGAVAIASLPGDVTALSASADGSRVAYAADNAIYGEDANHHTRVAVLNVSGLLVHQVAAMDYRYFYRGAEGEGAFTPALSADGSEVLFTHRTYDGHVGQAYGLETLVQPVSGAAPATELADLQSASLLPNGRLIGLDPSGSLITVDSSGGDRQPVTGAPTRIRELAVSPDGSRVAYTSWDAAPGLAALTGTGKELALGTPTAFGDLPLRPQFSSDSSSVYYVHETSSGSTTVDTLRSVPAAGGSVHDVGPASFTGPMAFVGVRYDATPPGAALAYGPLLGPKPVIRWGFPLDSDLAGVTVTRTAPDRPTTTRFVSAPATSFVDDAVRLGTDYTYTFVSQDRSGNTGPPSSTHMVATDNAMGVPLVTSFVTTGTSFPVYLPPSDHYKVWVTDVSARHTYEWHTSGSGRHDFGKDGYSVSEPGHTYAFRYQVFDTYGNASLPVTARASVPLDDRALSYRGTVARINGVHLWQHTATVLRPGATATVTVRGGYGAVYGTWCPTCGYVDVLRDGTLVLSVSTYANRREDNMLLTLLPTTKQPTTYVLRARGVGTARDVVIDSLSYRL